MRDGTKVIHGGQRPEPMTGAVMPPIFTASTFVQESPGVHSGFEYSRAGNPTRFALERLVASLENTGLSEEQDPSCGGFAFASGMAAMATALELLDAGSEVLAMDDLYGGSNRIMTKIRSRSQGLEVRYADLSRPNAIEQAMTPTTAMVWVETPTNPLLKIVDLDAVAKAARAANPDVILVCDNTFATPLGHRPLEFGFDVVLHSATKYLNGHSDVIGGLLVTRRADLAERIRFLQKAVGAILGPFDCYLTLRGLKTLDVRMQRHDESARRIAEYLEQHPSVERVLYPGLDSHPNAEVAKKQMKLAGGMLTFFVRGGDPAARKVLENVRVFALAESLGGVESLIEHPAIMTHASISDELRAGLGITDNLIRLSVGIEDCDDLLADLDQALAAATGSARTVHTTGRKPVGC